MLKIAFEQITTGYFTGSLDYISIMLWIHDSSTGKMFIMWKYEQCVTWTGIVNGMWWIKIMINVYKP